jgi:hypothetical protein
VPAGADLDIVKVLLSVSGGVHEYEDASRSLVPDARPVVFAALLDAGASLEDN